MTIRTRTVCKQHQLHQLSYRRVHRLILFFVFISHHSEQLEQEAWPVGCLKDEVKLLTKINTLSQKTKNQNIVIANYRIAVEVCRLLRICGPVRELTEEDVAAPHQRDPLDAEHQTEDGPVKSKIKERQNYANI